MHAIHAICYCQALLPRSLAFPLCYDKLETRQCAGGFTDVSKGQYAGREVAVKVLRVYSDSDIRQIEEVGHWRSSLSRSILTTDRVLQMFYWEIVAWRTLHHPNILPLLGATMSEDRFAMVSEWMPNGTINEFVTKNVNANRFELVRFSFRVLILAGL